MRALRRNGASTTPYRARGLSTCQQREWERHLVWGPVACALRWVGHVVEDCLRLDLDPPARIEQAGDDDHRARRANLAEDLPVDAPDRLPVGPVDEICARSDDVGRTSAELGQGGEDDREAAARLGRGIRVARSVRPDRSRAADA